jgi:UDP-glucuronate 4-epimerase
MHSRDFTYIDDIVEGVLKVLDEPATPNPAWSGLHPDSGSSMAPWLVYNIGNNHPIKLMDYIEAIENALGKKAEKVFVPLQPGDVPKTYADIQDLVEQFNYKPSTSLEEGIMNFVSWYRKYYEI